VKIVGAAVSLGGLVLISELFFHAMTPQCRGEAGSSTENDVPFWKFAFCARPPMSPSFFPVPLGETATFAASQVVEYSPPSRGQRLWRIHVDLEPGKGLPLPKGKTQLC